MALVYCDSCMSPTIGGETRARPFYCDSCLAQGSRPLSGAPRTAPRSRPRGLFARLYAPVAGLARRIDRLLRRKYRP